MSDVSFAIRKSTSNMDANISSKICYAIGYIKL